MTLKSYNKLKPEPAKKNCVANSVFDLGAWMKNIRRINGRNTENKHHFGKLGRFPCFILVTFLPTQGRLAGGE